jgi:hypothetical protein
MGTTHCTRKSFRLAPSNSSCYGGETLRHNNTNMSGRVTALASGNLRVVWNGFPIITWVKGVVTTSTDCYKVSVKTGTIFKNCRCKAKATIILKHVRCGCFGVLKLL